MCVWLVVVAVWRDLLLIDYLCKMADGSVHVLNDVLGFVNCKYGRLPAKQLKSVLIDFYDEEAISKAKVCLLNDIMKINSSVKHPHIPQRRDGDNRLTREIDDIVTLFCFVDENNLTSNLPRYVSSNPDSMPSSRIYEGDLRSIMAVLLLLLDKMSDKIGELGRALSAISHDVNTLQRAVGGQSSYTSEPATACAINRSVGQRDHQQVQPRSTHMGNYAENATRLLFQLIQLTLLVEAFNNQIHLTRLANGLRFLQRHYLVVTDLMHWHQPQMTMSTVTSKMIPLLWFNAGEINGSVMELRHRSNPCNDSCSNHCLLKRFCRSLASL